MKKFLFLIIISLLFFNIGLEAQQITKILKGTNHNAYTRIGPPEVFTYRNQLGKIAISNFIVDYEVSVPQAAETAFNYAIEIWSHLISLSKPVKIKVNFVYESGGMLGATTVDKFRNNYSNLPIVNTQYPISLAKNLDNSIVYNDYDFTIDFNGMQPFNYSTDGQPVFNQFDFVSIALHEIGHGLGLVGAAFIDANGNASIRFSGHPNSTSTSYPTTTDQYYVSGTTKLIEVTNPSTLKNLLLSNNVYFNGPNAKIANNNQNVKMYAPSTWAGGSSIDHLDEDTFPAGNENSLMTPYIDRAEVNHSPGKIFLAMLKDYGHTLGRNITFNSPIVGSQIVKNQNFIVQWFDNISGLGDYIDLELWKVTSVDPMFISTINSSPVFSSPGITNNTFNWLVSNALSDGFYFLKAVGYNHTVDFGKSSDFSISTIPEAPHFNPPPSQYATTQFVSLYTNSPVSEIRYTLDGSEPTLASPLFIPLSTITVSSSLRIRARSYLILSDNSKVASPTSDADYYIGVNSFEKEFTTSSGNYGWIYYGTIGANSGTNWIQMGLPSNNNDAKYRSYAKWSGIKSQIPTGAYIQSVEFDIPVNQIMTTAASLEFRYYTGGGDIIDKWDNIGAGTPVATMPANTGTFSISGFVSYIQAIVNGGGDYFAIGIKSSNESNIDHFTSFGFPIRMRIYYRGNIEISQLDKDNHQFGQVEYWNATYWDPKNAPATLFKTGNVTLKSYQDFKDGTSQKYKEWLRQTDIVNFNTFPITANVVNFFDAKFDQSNQSPKVKNYYLEQSSLNPITDKIWFKDPWLQDEIVATYGKRNQGISGGTTGLPGADWHQLDSPIDFSDPAFSNYKGVFLNQRFDIPNNPYYSVKVDAVQDIPLFTTGVPTGNGRTHKFYFQNWSGSNVNFQNSNALETPVVFTQEGAFAQARLKGTQLSTTANAFNSNSQRKYVKSDDGYLHLVYESMGTVWYEVSPDNGATWYIQNNGKPISTSGKQPAIDYGSFYDQSTQETYHQTAITWQESYGSSSSKIKVAYFDRFEDVLIGRMNWRDTKDVATVSGSYSTTNCYPIICMAYSNFNIVYKNGAAGALLSRTGVVNISYGIYFSINNPLTLTGTNSYSVNPSIAVNKTGTTTVRLVWEHIQNDEYSSIKYAVLVGAQISGSTTTISTNSGSPLNFSPSISIANNAPVVSWTGARNPGDGIDKRKAITTRGTNWGSFQVAGTDINFVNNNSALGTAERTVISWSEGTTNPVTKWMRREGIYYSTPRTLSNSGYQSQLCTGTNFQTMSAMVFKDNRVPHSSDPHYFLKSTTDFSTLEEEINPGLNKITENDTLVTFGRSGVASINDIEFVFEIGDILLGDSIIKFLEIPDTISYSSTNELNAHTRTSNFTLTPSTNFYFSNIYYVVTKSNPDTALTNTDAVNFKAELVNASTNQVVGTFDNMTYNKNNLEKYASIDYEVDCSGITAGDYFLRLVTSVNTDAAYGLANIVSDNTTLAKKNFNKVNFTGKEIPITYELSNNFPNPFNPSTTIRYQIPQDGIVTLKIYDILGSEVATLVNEEKIAGKYEVNFNAASFASGVYIYKIQAGSFINSKKMILLK